jgi:hypothetical protein
LEIKLDSKLTVVTDMARMCLHDGISGQIKFAYLSSVLILV